MKKLLHRILSLGAMLCIGAVVANAEQFPTDGSEIQLGNVYDLTMFEMYNATFTPTADGVLSQYGNGDLQIVKVDSGKMLKRDYRGYVTFEGVYGPQYDYDVEKGVEYAVQGSPWSDGRVAFVMANLISLSLERVDPRAGSVISQFTNNSGDILLYFSTTAKVGSAYLVADETEVVAELMNLSGSLIAVRIADAMKFLYLNGTINRKGGNKVTLSLRGVVDIDRKPYQGTGVINIDYIAAPCPIDIINTNISFGHPLKSYYPAGAEEGIFWFEFNAPILDDGTSEVFLSLGDPSFADKYYYEELTPEIEGNRLSVDLTGKLRDLNPYLSEYNTNIGLKLSNVRDLDGRPSAGSGSGNVGSYDFSLSYRYIEPVTIVSEFTPGNGESLKGVNQIEIWFNYSDMITFDGVKFAAEDLEVIVPIEDLDISYEGRDCIIIVNVPAEFEGIEGVNVSLNNVIGLDGYNHSVSAEYDKFVVTLAAPILPGQAIESTGTEDFVFLLNNETYGYYRYDFYNEENAWAYGTELVKQEDGTWTASNPNIVCYKYFDPVLIVTAYDTIEDWGLGVAPVAEYRFSFKGLTSPFEYSTFEFEGITPDPIEPLEYTEEVPVVFTATFNGLVTLDPAVTCISLGYGMTMPFDEIRPVYIEGISDDSEHEGYATVWQLCPSMEFLSGVRDITFSIKAFDLDGKLIRGNIGGGEADYLLFTYYIIDNEAEAGTVELTLTPGDGEVVHTLDRIDITAPGIEEARADCKDPILITNAAGETIHTETANQLNEKSFDWEAFEFRGFYISPAIEEDGEYTVSIPESFFEFEDMSKSAALTALITLKDHSAVENIVVSTAGIYEVYTLQGIKLFATPDVNRLRTLPAGLYIVNGRKLAIR